MHKTIIWSFNITKKEWGKLTPLEKNLVKSHLLDCYKNAITVESFSNAEKLLLKIRNWEG